MFLGGSRARIGNGVLAGGDIQGSCKVMQRVCNRRLWMICVWITNKVADMDKVGVLRTEVIKE